MLKLLLLEDSRPDAELIQATLEDGGIAFESHRVETQYTFVQSLQNQSFDLILSDYVLRPPDKVSFDGITALRIARELAPDIPFIFVSGMLGEDLAIEALKSGATDYVLKRSLERLVPVVNRALAEAAQRAERKMLLVELKRRAQELEAAVRARDEFLAIASHELKNPLTALRLQLQMLLYEASEGMQVSISPERVITKLQIAEKESGRLSKIINDLLDVSRISAGKLELHFEQFDFASALRDILESHAEDLKRGGCRVYLDLDSPLVGCWDRTRIEQIISNLLSNTVKYAPGKPVFISLRRVGQTCVLTVKDEGVGIPHDKLDKIFERFERASSDSNTVGLGLGLYIIRQIVMALQGKIAVESEPEKGSTFTVVLPVNPGTESFASTPGYPDRLC